MTPADTSEFNLSVLKRVETQIRQNPDRSAICTPSKRVSYKELDDLSNRIACELVNLSEIKGHSVAVLSSEPAILAAGLLACLKIGAIYAPVDPEQPMARARQITSKLDAVALVTESSRESLVRDLADAFVLVMVVDRIEKDRTDPVIRTQIPTSRLLWIMHTSGSTGNPKGVMQTEANVSRFVWQVTNGLKLVQSDTLAFAASLNSHAGAVMCLATLCNAATFCPLDLRKVALEDVPDFLAMHRVTLLFTVPGILSTLYRLDGTGECRFPALRLIRLSGETVTREDIECCWRMFPELETVSVGYGTTETGGISQQSFAREDALPENPIPVGKNVEGVEIRILDEHGNPMGADEHGEIVVVSRFFSPGYWKDPASTRTAFQRLDEGLTLYATGDVGRLQSDGVLVHEGRCDFQFNRTGNRIEPREIELALLKMPAIIHSVVRPMPSIQGMKIVAYLVLRSGYSLNDSRIRRHLHKFLPPYMIPDHFVRLDSIPRTRLGKVAYEDLPVPPSIARVPQTDCQGGNENRRESGSGFVVDRRDTEG